MNKIEANETGSHRHEAELKVKVVNENNGKHAEFKADRGALVETVIEQMYASSELGIGRGRSPEDRLRCKGQGKEDGADIFKFSELPLEELREKHCRSLDWRFAGPTGGA